MAALGQARTAEVVSAARIGEAEAFKDSEIKVPRRSEILLTMVAVQNRTSER